MKLMAIIIMLFICISAFQGCINSNSDYEKIIVIGETDAINGVYDPSIEYDKHGIGWMTYSTVKAPEYVSTHIAKSEDHGKTWTYVTTINQAINGTIMINDTTLQGVWRHEVSTLVNDPSDSGKEWKIFWHKYFTIPPYDVEQRLFQYGWIAYKYAHNPEGPWSDEIALFGSGFFPLEPFDTRYNLSGFHPDLAENIVYSEPGSLLFNDTLYLSLNAHSIIDGNNIGKTILIKSNDHGNTWEYVTILLEPQDVEAYNGIYFTGTSLVKEKNRLFLLACPENPNNGIKHHLGTYIFEFEDIDKGLLQRDVNDTLILHKYIALSLISGGQSDYDEQNTYGGIVIPQHNYLALPEFFQIYNTKISIV